MLELQVRQPSLSVLSMQSAELRGPSSYPAFSLADPPHTHPDAYLRVRALPTLRSACARRGRVRSVPRGGRCGHMAHRRPPFANTLRSGACINGLDVWAPFRDCCTVVVPAYRNSPAVVGRSAIVGRHLVRCHTEPVGVAAQAYGSPWSSQGTEVLLLPFAQSAET